MVHCKPVDPELTLGISGISHTSMRRMQGKHNVTIVTTELEITVGHWPISGIMPNSLWPDILPMLCATAVGFMLARMSRPFRGVSDQH